MELFSDDAAALLSSSPSGKVKAVFRSAVVIKQKLFTEAVKAK